MKRLALNIQELRYGNLIKLKPDDTTCIIHVIYGKSFASAWCTGGMESVFPNKNQRFESIPLSEKWLLNFGFEKANDLDSWHKMKNYKTL